MNYRRVARFITDDKKDDLALVDNLVLRVRNGLAHVYGKLNGPIEKRSDTVYFTLPINNSNKNLINDLKEDEMYETYVTEQYDLETDSNVEFLNLRRKVIIKEVPYADILMEDRAKIQKNLKKSYEIVTF